MVPMQKCWLALINSEEKIFEFKTFNILDDEFPEDHLECDGWIITGSPHGVYRRVTMDENN